MEIFLAFCIVCPCYCLSDVYKCLCDCLKQCLSKCCCKNKEQYDSLESSSTESKETDDESNSPESTSQLFDKTEILNDDDESKRKEKSTASSTINNIVQSNKIKLVRKNISLLWLQYCKLYVIGYTRYYDITQPIKIIMEKNYNEDNDDSGEMKNGCCFLECKKRGEDATCTHPCCCLRCSRQCCSQCGNESTCPDINIMCCNKKFSNRFLSKHIIRAFLFSVKYLSCYHDIINIIMISYIINIIMISSILS